MITLKKSGYTKEDLIALKKVVAEGISKIQCTGDCGECKTLKVCGDLSRLKKYVTTVLNTVN